MAEKSLNPLTDRIKAIMEDADIDKVEDVDTSKLDLTKALSMLIVALVLFGAILCAGCISDDAKPISSSTQDVTLFDSDVIHYYVPSLDKYISSEDSQFDELYKKYGSEMEVTHKTFRPIST